MENTDIFLFLLLPQPACWLLLDVCKYYRTPGLVPGLLRTLCCRPRHREGGGHQDPHRGERREERNIRGSSRAPEARHRVHHESDCAAGLRSGIRVHWCLHSVQVRGNDIRDLDHEGTFYLVLLTVTTRHSRQNRWKIVERDPLWTSTTFRTSRSRWRGPS